MFFFFRISNFEFPEADGQITQHRTKISVNDPTDHKNESFLFHGAFGNRKRCVRSLLFKHNADVEVLKKPSMVTPIFAAIAKNNIEIVQMLLDRNSKLNVESDDGALFPLFLATIMGHHQCTSPLFISFLHDINNDYKQVS